METLKLIRPNENYVNQIRAYRQEFLDAGSSMDGTGPLFRLDDPREWLRLCAQFEKGEDLPKNWVKSVQFLYIRESDDRLVGMLQLRPTFNEFLRKYAGNIGYSVRPSERRKGYAKSMLRSALPLCREWGLERVLVACLQDNEASRRTILANGGQYESTVLEPEKNKLLERYWIFLQTNCE